MSRKHLTAGVPLCPPAACRARGQGGYILQFRSLTYAPETHLP